MSSFLWLLLYLAPLLGLTAALFAWFGWQWRGFDMQKRIDELAAEIARAETALREAEAARGAALALPHLSQSLISDEFQSLRAPLNSAQAEAHLREDEAAKAHETSQALETKVALLLDDLEQLRANHAATLAELATLRSLRPAADDEIAAPVSVEPTATAKRKRKRKRSTSAKPNAPVPAAAPASLREKIASLENQLSERQAGLATLRQERDDWQRRIRKVEEQIPADPAGLGLARRSLADSEKRLATATSEIERLQNQTRVLLHVEETAAERAEVPDDDLTQIKGIKKVISEQLRAHGVRTWRQIALWDADERSAFSEILAFKNRATREKWQEQARTLHEVTHGPLA